MARLGLARGVVVAEDDGGRVVANRAAHHLARVHGDAVEGAAEQRLEGEDPVAVVEEEAGEDLEGVGAKPRGEVAPRLLGARERPVAANARLHPPQVQVEERVHAGPVLAGEEEVARRRVGNVEEAANPPGRGQGRGVDADADQVEELVVFEGAGAGALEARERVARGRRGLRGESGGGLGADRVDVGGAHGLSLGTAWGAALRGEADGLRPSPGTAPASRPGSASRRRDARPSLPFGPGADARRRDPRPAAGAATASPSPRTTPPPRRRRRSGRGGARRRGRGRRAAGR